MLESHLGGCSGGILVLSEDVHDILRFDDVNKQARKIEGDQISETIEVFFLEFLLKEIMDEFQGYSPIKHVPVHEYDILPILSV